MGGKEKWFEKFQSSGENVTNKPSSATRKAQTCETTVVKQTAKQPPKKKTINTSVTQMTGTEIGAIVSRNNGERRANSETHLKIAVNKEVDHRKGTLTATLETIAEFVVVIVPVRIIIGVPVGQLTTGGLS